MLLIEFYCFYLISYSKSPFVLTQRIYGFITSAAFRVKLLYYSHSIRRNVRKHRDRLQTVNPLQHLPVFQLELCIFDIAKC
jgi:hypothetical protein